MLFAPALLALGSATTLSEDARTASSSASSGAHTSRSLNQGQGAPVVVFIHGRGQAGKHIDDVRQQFYGAFDAAQRAWLGSSVVPSTGRAFVWYADLIDDGAEAYPGAGACAAAQEPPPEETARADDWRTRLIKFAQTLGLADDALRWFTEDTYRYLKSTHSRCEVDVRLETELRRQGLLKRPLVIVAHSMGGIVTFAALQKNAQTIFPERRLAVPRLVTIGTQVALPLIQEGINGRLVELPVDEPITIASWRNFMNDGDKLAFSTTGAFLATDAARLPRDYPINAPGDRHASTTYLSDRRVVRAILWSWCTAHPAGVGKPAQCAAVEAAGDV